MRTAYFPRLTGGLVRDADRYSVGPQTYPLLWYDLKNLIAYRGRLQRREGIAGGALFPPVPPEGATADYPILITSVQLLDNQDRFIIVTTRDLWVGGSGGIAAVFYNATPIYATGTVTASTGSPIITGSGTAWLTRRIGAGQMFKAEGAWYVINSVDSETQVTLATNYAGAGGAGLSYEIRRTFGGSVVRPFAACRILNGDAYLVIRDGGIYQNPTTGLNTGSSVIVLKVSRAADTAKTSFSGADTTILMSTDAIEASTAAVGEVVLPKGFEILDDGRLVVACHTQNKTGASPSHWINNRVYYSSHLDPTVWTTSPGGFTDIIGRRGGITAMLKLGTELAIHRNDGVTLALATGASDPPLSFRETRAHVGAAGPRLVQNVPPGRYSPQGQFFVDGVGAAYIFDGDRAAEIPTGWEQISRDDVAAGEGGHPSTTATEGFLAYEEFRRSVSLFSSRDVIGETSRELRFDLDTGVVSRHIWKNFISAASTQRMFPDPTSSRVVGVRGTNSAGSSTAYLYQTGYETLNDSTLPVVTVGKTTTGMLSETHDLLLWDQLESDPQARPGVETVIRRVMVWYVGRAATTESLKCSISRDAGGTWTTVTESKTLTTAANERRVDFFFDTAGASEKWRIKIESNDTDIFSYHLTRMAVDFSVVADARALDVA